MHIFSVIDTLLKFWHAICIKQVKEFIFQIPKAMKKFIHTSILALLLAGGGAVLAQDYPEEYLGLPGDNLNLYAVLNLFQESETLEAFERDLNDPDSRINNLDLNGDNYVDYITVSDYKDGNVHNIVLRVALNRKDQQDVAVFVVEQLRDGSVQIQLIGDEALYGKNYIIEPNYAETPNPGYTGGAVRTNNVNVVRTTYYEVAAWPVIRFIYRPSYVVWRSSWYWGYYPSYWVSWRPSYWHYYYGYHSHWYPHYYSWYRPCNYYRWNGYHNHYYSRVRVYSPTVVVNINKGYYRTTYSRPDQRRAGEALYSSVRTSRDGSARNSTVYRSLERETASSRTARERGTSVNTGTDRRTPATVNDSRSSRSSAVQRTTSQGTRREATTPNRTVTRSSSGQAAPATRSTSATQTRKSTSTQGTVQRSSTTRSSSAPSAVQRSSTTRSSSAPSAVQRSSTTRSSATPPSVQRSSSSRSSSAPSTVQRSSAPKSSSAPKASVQRSATSRSTGNSAPRVSSPSQSRSSGAARSNSNASRSGSSSKDAGSSRPSRK